MGMATKPDDLQACAEQKALLAKIETAKQEWEKAMDCVSDMVILTDKQGRIRRCNLAFSAFSNKSYTELLGRSWPQEAAALGLQKMESVEGQEGATELIHQASGRVYLHRAYPLVIRGEQVGDVFILQDATERIVASQELQAHRKALQRALDELSIMIERVSQDKAFGNYFALPPNMSQCWKDMACEQKDCPCYGREPTRCWQIAGTRCLDKTQGEFAQKIGECTQCKFYQESVSDPVYKIGEEFNHMMVILDTKNKELEQANADLRASQSQLLQQEKMASIGQLAAGVAHEINNPVGFVKSNLGTLAKYVGRLTEFVQEQNAFIEAAGELPGADDLRAKQKKMKLDYVLADAVDLIGESLDGVDRVQAIVQNLKSFSRVDQAERVRSDINNCLEDTLNIIWNELKYKTIVHKDYGELPLIYCYPQQLNQVFMNLLVNAAQAIAEKGEISIKTWAEDTDVLVSIADTGSGIAPENVSRLFEPFFTTKEVGKGTGLGLSIVYDIITKKHGGAISVHSELGAGTTFTVRLPAGDDK